MEAGQIQHVESITQSTGATSNESLRNTALDDNTLDTLTLAKRLFEKQGPYEVEVTCGDEADLHKHKNSCKKNPGHDKFIPADQFTMEHLPQPYRNDEETDFIRALSNLTVRVSCKYVSDKRPQTWPGSDEPFPRYDGGPRNMTRVGTGYVNYIFHVPDTCPCKECIESDTPKTEFAYVEIVTAAHVVYDKLEAEHTICHFFFDSGGTPENCCGVVALDDLRNVWPDIQHDSIEMTYITHDMNLVSRLIKNNTLVLLYENKHCDTTSNDFFNWDVQDLSSLTVIVSHPHGCSKQISLGYIGPNDKVWEKDNYTYNNATCPGSSGARVFVLRNKYFDYWYYLIHSGSREQNSNYCSSNPYYRYKNVQHEKNVDLAIYNKHLNNNRYPTERQMKILLRERPLEQAIADIFNPTLFTKLEPL